MIVINNSIKLDDDELIFSFIKSSGPGGQNVNKVSTAVQLKFNIQKSKNLSEDIKIKIIANGGKRVTNSGILVIEAKRFRTQERNKKDAIERLTKFILRCTKLRKLRKKTKPTKASEEKRIGSKKLRGNLKKQRKKIIKDF